MLQKSVNGKKIATLSVGLVTPVPVVLTFYYQQCIPYTIPAQQYIYIKFGTVLITLSGGRLWKSYLLSYFQNCSSGRLRRSMVLEWNCREKETFLTEQSSQKPEFWWMANWTWASNVPWQPRKPTVLYINMFLHPKITSGCLYSTINCMKPKPKRHLIKTAKQGLSWALRKA